ncbi:putative ABC exporter domain-containing protein [Archangium lipolyticum]|uniref:putative ABC exporter domain-containing protein n=1 Tax=Archangium lipolyticum TaxID=2970465 RepID=UPI00214A0DC2|nr:putative ABC exporter domain-containing protein [Archangium lipolyticum]
MSFARAVVFLWLATARNRVLHQLRRLRQPKYLVGALVGGMYVYSVFLRRLHAAGDEGMPQVPQLLSHFLFTAAMLGTLLSAWTLGPDRPALTFSETEVQQLFPAPVSRRGLLHYKLVRGLFGAVMAAFFATLFVGRVVTKHPVLFFLGTSVTLATVSLHVMGASFVRTRLARRGGVGTALRWGAIAAVLAGMLVSGLSALRELPSFDPAQLRGSRQFEGWIATVLALPALWPGRLLVALPLAADAWGFLKALPLGLGLFAVHYVWVMRASVSFEESAVLRAEERARLREQLSRQGGRPTLIRAGATPFRLASTGRPEVALVWKNLIAARRLGGAGRLLVAGLVGGLVAAMMSSRGAAEMVANVRMFMAPVCAGIAVMLSFFGPSALRVDLRMDLPRMEQLRALPLTGRQVVAAEIAAPALLLGGTQVVLVLAAMVLSVWQGGAYAVLWAAGGLGAIWVLPAVSLGGLFVQNAAVVLFPAWLPPEGERVRGIEALGQRLLTLAGTLVVLLVGMLPAAIVAGLVALVLDRFLGFGAWALPFAGFVAAAVLVGEVALGVMGLGHAFDRLDVSREGPETSS